MSSIPFILNLDSQPFYGHNVFPNRMYRRLHPRQHELLDFPTLAMIARLGPHAHHLSAKRHGAIPTLSADKQAVEFNLDVGLFQPNDLTVKLANDYVVIEGKHEEREDEHGHVTRHFVRRYKLPNDYDPDVITSSLTSDGVLTIRVPKPAPNKEVKGNERVVQIHQSVPSDLFVRSASNSIENDK